VIAMIEGLRPRNPRVALASFGGVAAALALLLGAFAFLLPLTPGYLAKPSADLIGRLALWSFFADHAPDALSRPEVIAPLLIAGSALAFALYGVAIWMSWGQRGRAWVALALLSGLLFFTIGAFAQPNQTRNVWNYIMRGRLTGVYGENPYRVAVDEVRSDPLYRYANPKYTARPGGKLPTWKLLSAPLARFAGDDPVDVLLTYRLALLAVNFASLLLVAAVLARWDPQRLVAGLVVFGWNPIVAAYGESKTDTLMVFYLLAAVALLSRGWRRIAAVSLVLSIFVKLVTLPLLAIGALRELRRLHWRELAIGAVVVGATTVALYLPYADGDLFGLLFSHLGMLDSGAAGASGGGSRRLLALGFGALVLAVGVFARDDDRAMVRGWTLVLLYFSLFVAKFAYADYLMTWIALVAVTLDWQMIALVVVLSAAAFTFTVWYQTDTIELPLPDVFDLPPWVIYLAPAAAMALGLVVLAAVRRGVRLPEIRPLLRQRRVLR
jgi:hypothetical protein